MKKKTLLAISMIIAGASTSYAETKIAVVNPVQIFNDANLGSLSVKQIENEIKPEANKLKQEQDKISQQAQDLQKGSATMTKAALTSKQEEIQKEYQLFTEKAQALQKKEYTKKEELSNKFQASFDAAVSSVAKQKGYNMVVTTQSLAYSNGIDDISSDVVALMNK
ncbi:OmpH family outer membrane protein [Pseudofrancisella aestuarii]|uniref:OmpH family outer membrane protein n=1 Tax=Pseudofrancisella aestuarii TaxID=2670347 RepID=A0ABV9TDC8_9GAMM|nr:OmpH family outer membrane protein [Pseudofrancisella aestuarii]